MSVNIFKYAIKSEGATYYCKVVETIIHETASYSFMFGGKKSYCFIAAMDSDNNYQPYIDRVEYEDNCMMQGDIKGNTVSLVKAALWTMKRLFSDITKFTLIDDSYIYCHKGSKLHKLSLAYDYILKKNKTWYEYHFNAKLPAPIYPFYTKSLSGLDARLKAFHIVSERIGNIHKYKDLYNDSKTPREFINNLRHVYKERYCFEVGSWLSQYMEYIGVNYYTRDWYIDINDVHKPNSYELYTSTQQMKGGKIKRCTKTRRAHRKSTCVGYYGDEGFEN